MKRFGLFLMAVVFPLLVAAPSEAATIYACRKKIGGTIRIVSAKAVCLDTETRISWNSVGPRGPMGPPGNMALAGQQCRSGQVITGYDSAGKLVCTWSMYMAPFADMDLRNFNFTNANFNNVNFVRSNLTGVNLAGAFLGIINGGEAILAGANLSNALMSAGDWNYADFSNANLSNARIVNVEFFATNMSGANLSSAELIRADFYRALNMDTAILTGTTWSMTHCPDGSYSHTNGTSPESCEGHLTPSP